MKITSLSVNIELNCFYLIFKTNDIILEKVFSILRTFINLKQKFDVTFWFLRAIQHQVQKLKLG